MTVGDVVLIKDDNLPRNQWCRIHECYTDNDGHVLKVKLVIASSSLDKYDKRQDHVTYLERTIYKLVLLHETGVFPTVQFINCATDNYDTLRLFAYALYSTSA